MFKYVVILWFRVWLVLVVRVVCFGVLVLGFDRCCGFVVVGCCWGVVVGVVCCGRLLCCLGKFLVYWCWWLLLGWCWGCFIVVFVCVSSVGFGGCCWVVCRLVLLVVLVGSWGCCWFLLWFSWSVWSVCCGSFILCLGYCLGDIVLFLVCWLWWIRIVWCKLCCCCFLVLIWWLCGWFWFGLVCGYCGWLGSWYVVVFCLGCWCVRLVLLVWCVCWGCVGWVWCIVLGFGLVSWGREV